MLPLQNYINNKMSQINPDIMSKVMTYTSPFLQAKTLFLRADREHNPELKNEAITLLCSLQAVVERGMGWAFKMRDRLKRNPYDLVNIYDHVSPEGIQLGMPIVVCKRLYPTLRPTQDDVLQKYFNSFDFHIIGAYDVSKYVVFTRLSTYTREGFSDQPDYDETLLGKEFIYQEIGGRKKILAQAEIETRDVLEFISRLEIPFHFFLRCETYDYFWDGVTYLSLSHPHIYVKCNDTSDETFIGPEFNQYLCYDITDSLSTQCILQNQAYQHDDTINPSGVSIISSAHLNSINLRNAIGLGYFCLKGDVSGLQVVEGDPTIIANILKIISMQS
jgi:hypothetical protein